MDYSTDLPVATDYLHVHLPYPVGSFDIELLGDAAIPVRAWLRERLMQTEGDWFPLGDPLLDATVSPGVWSITLARPAGDRDLMVEVEMGQKGGPVVVRGFTLNATGSGDARGKFKRLVA